MTVILTSSYGYYQTNFGTTYEQWPPEKQPPEVNFPEEAEKVSSILTLMNAKVLAQKHQIIDVL